MLNVSIKKETYRDIQVKYQRLILHHFKAQGDNFKIKQCEKPAPTFCSLLNCSLKQPDGIGTIPHTCKPGMAALDIHGFIRK